MAETSQPLKIIIAENQFLVSEGLKSFLKDRFEILSIVASKHELLRQIADTPPDIVIVDHGIPETEDIGFIGIMKKQWPHILVVVLSNTFSYQDVQSLKNAGITHMICMNADKEELDHCMENLIKGRKYYSEYILDLILENNDKRYPLSDNAQLTPSELEIVRLISDGLTNKEIASKKYLSVHTIMTHRKNILRKMGVSNASELIMAAIKRGYIDAIEYHI